MKNTRPLRLILSCVVMVAILAPVLRAAPAPQVSIGDAQSAYSAGEYQDCLRKISTLLSSTSIKPGSTERYDLLMMRGECMLKMKQPVAAATAFDAAANIRKNQVDLPRIANAEAMQALVKASKGLKYKPRNSPPGDEGIDIVAPDSRKQAFGAMFEDRRGEVMPGVVKALADTSLTPLQKLMPEMWEVYVLEFAATGETKQTSDDLKKLGEHARELIGGELKHISGRIEQLNNLASEPNIARNFGSGDQVGYRGLNSNERKELQELADYLVNIQKVTEKGRRISRQLGGQIEAWDALLAECAETRDVAQQAFEKRY